MIGTTVSHYTILSRLGAGGMGVVYEAEDTRLGRKVAIKFLADDARDAGSVQRFEREARVISSLHHPNICTLFDVGSHEGRQFMVMELLDGQSLKERIARGALGVDEVLELGAQMADALEAAHAQGVIHRDIKPANLYVTSRGGLTVLDFGVAKLHESRAGSSDLDVTTGGSDQLTNAGTTIGTIAYMSPEQARGEELDARSDVFSAGVVLYEMATGQLPFQGPTVATMFEALLTRPPAPPSQVKAGIPAELDRIIVKALEKDRARCYQSAAELRIDLKRLQRRSESGVVSSAQDVPAPVSAPVPPRRRWPLYVGAPLVMALAVGGFLLYRSVTTPALTQKDLVVLAPVANRTSDAMFDDTLGEALGLQLRQSPFLNLVPDQEVQATLRLMDRGPGTALSGDVGREVCQRIGARALLGGSIAMLGSSFVITITAQDCVEGKIFAEQQAQAPTKEAVLAAMGTAASEFRKQLGESLASVQRYDARIEEATTRSLEALKAYSQGLRARRTTGDFDAVPFLRRAIELDPEFALAYARLGTVYSNLNKADEAKKMTARAFELRNKVSEAERFYIEARYYTTVESNPQKALDTYNVWLATYPNEYTALANSGSLLRSLGNREEAITKLELSTKVAPDQPLGWTNLAQTYAEMVRWDDARRTYETAIKLSDTTSARVGLFQVAVLMGDAALADAQVAAVRGRRDESVMLGIRMYAATYRGRLKEASDLAAELQPKAVALSLAQSIAPQLLDLAVAEALFGDREAAKDRVRQAEADALLDDSTLEAQMAVAALAGDAPRARALMARIMDAQPTGQQVSSSGNAPDQGKVATSLLRMAEGKPADAVAALEPFRPESARSDILGMWCLAKMQAKDWPAALKGFTLLASGSAPRNLGPTLPFAYTGLARTQAAMGDTAAARASYQKLFELFKDADPDLPLLVQAREEFGKLGS